MTMATFQQTSEGELVIPSPMSSTVLQQHPCTVSFCVGVTSGSNRHLASLSGAWLKQIWSQVGLVSMFLHVV